MNAALKNKAHKTLISFTVRICFICKLRDITICTFAGWAASDAQSHNCRQDQTGQGEKLSLLSRKQFLIGALPTWQIKLYLTKTCYLFSYLYWQMVISCGLAAIMVVSVLYFLPFNDGDKKFCVISTTIGTYRNIVYKNLFEELQFYYISVVS